MRIPNAFQDAMPFLAEFEATAAAMAPAEGPGWDIIPCNMKKQEKTEWCWAAVTQCVERRAGSNPSQCEIAHDVLGSPPCSQDCAAPKCNGPAKLSAALNIRGMLLPPAIDDTVEFDDIKEQITTQKKVVCCTITRPPNGHAVIICGYLEDGGNQSVAILDPATSVAAGPQAHDFNQFRNIAYSEGGTWTGTCFTD